MNIKELRQKITELLDKRNNAPLTANEIATGLKLRGKVRKQLQTLLNQLVLSGDIVRIRNNRYSLGAPVDLVAGRLDVTRSGNGFVTETGTGVDVFVPAADLGTALPGDKVVARLCLDERERYSDSASRRRLKGRRAGIERKHPERLTGTVVRILERARRDIVGTLKSTGRFLYVVPINPAYHQDFYVPDSNGADINDRVVIRFTGWQNRHVSPEGEIIEVIGPADQASLDTISIIRHYGFKEEFPTEVMREAESASALMSKPGRRLDLRNKFIITIDPERARDFDDALSLDKDSDGNRVLGVHIADVGHFVKQGGAMDKEARTRGNSVYLPDKVIPMLPEQLSNGICSLRPDEDRLTFSVFITVDATGKVLSSEFKKTIIKSKLRLTYEQAMEVLGGSKSQKVEKSHDGQAVTLLKQLSVLAQQFRERRFARYALDLDTPECEIIIDANGMIANIRIVKDDISHQLIEECMIAANEEVARELSNRGMPIIYRVHEPPSDEKIEELTAQLAGMGYKPGDLRLPKNLSGFLKSIKDDLLVYHIHVAVLRSMKKAVYSSVPTGHFGLAKKFYTHFTSPIRRYPDLVVHRTLLATLFPGKHPSKQLEQRRVHGKVEGILAQDELTAIATACSQTEQMADEAENFLIEIKKYRFLSQELKRREPLVYDAVVVNVMNFGMFVEILDLQVQGLVHVSTISERFVRFSRKNGTLKAGREVYHLGRKVKVFVVNVDFDKRRLDFALA